MVTGMVIIATLLGVMVADGCPTYFAYKNCCQTKGNGFYFSTPLRSPVYKIANFCGDHEVLADAYCDTTTAGGGWLVIQKRKDGSISFDRNWVEYEDGFGNLTEEFWYGLRAIHCLTNQGQWELRIDYTLTTGKSGYISYSNFKVGGATTQYQLSISGFSGDTTDPFKGHNLNGAKFTTRDRDNDKFRANCAVPSQNNDLGNGGGWWFNSCSLIYPNGVYQHVRSIWFNSVWYRLSSIEMKIKPKVCSS